jgi:hypothetical protein
MKKLAQGYGNLAPTPYNPDFYTYILPLVDVIFESCTSCSCVVCADAAGLQFFPSYMLDPNSQLMIPARNMGVRLVSPHNSLLVPAGPNQQGLYKEICVWWMRPLPRFSLYAFRKLSILSNDLVTVKLVFH